MGIADPIGVGRAGVGSLARPGPQPPRPVRGRPLGLSRAGRWELFVAGGCPGMLAG